MSGSLEKLKTELESHFGGKISSSVLALGELTLELKKEQLLDVAQELRDNKAFMFEQLIDLCGVDYSQYAGEEEEQSRFAVVYHLLSVSLNQRLRLRVFVDTDFPVLTSVIETWSCADWYEREAFDLYGIIFEGHPDLRRILTDYGFVGHPFRKDFPLSGNVEMRYDEVKKRVVYEPVSIDTRINTPRIIRDDHRYATEIIEGGENG